MVDASFVKSLFGGIVTDGLIFPYPEPTRAQSDHLHTVLEAIRKLAARHVDSAQIDREARIGEELARAMCEAGLFGLNVPAEHGGSGLTASTYARAVQKLAWFDASLATTVMAHASLAVNAVQTFGTEALRARLLPSLARGEKLGAFALAEAGAGSDAASIQTRAERDGADYVVTGEKAWVTNGGVADVFVVFARTSGPEEGAKPRLTALVVERGPGVETGGREPTLGVRGASITGLTLDRVRVSEENVLGEHGRGFKVAMEALTHARVSLASSCIGVAKQLLKLSVDRVAERKAFGRTIGEFGLVRDKIAEMAAQTFAVESMVYLTSGLVDAGAADFAVESAICKIAASETLWSVANEAAQIAAATGYTQAYPWERLLRDARAAMVFQGTNEILRAFVSLSGMQAPARELEEVSKAMREPIKGFGLLSDVALRRAKSALSRERIAKAHPSLAREAAIFDEHTTHLARIVDKALRRYGKNIAEMQYLQKRVADVAIDLYAIASMLARTTRAIERRGEEGARREMDLLAVFTNVARRRLAENVARVDDNDDELRKALAQKTCADGGYPLDVI